MEPEESTPQTTPDVPSPSDTQEGVGLNFESAQLENAAAGASREFTAVADGVLPVVAVLLYILVVGFCSRAALKSKTSGVWPKISDWPAGVRVALIPLLVSFAGTHAFSAGSVYYNTTIANPNTNEYLANVGIGRLMGLSHAHLFAHATMYFLVAALFHATRAGWEQKIIVPQIAVWAGVFDIVSWWGLKQMSPNFEVLSAINGTAFSIGFLWMSFFILRDAISART